MADNKIEMDMGIQAARYGKLTAQVTVYAKITRRYIWMMKLRWIWSIIRADIDMSEIED